MKTKQSHILRILTAVAIIALGLSVSKQMPHRWDTFVANYTLRLFYANPFACASKMIINYIPPLWGFFTISSFGVLVEILLRRQIRIQELFQELGSCVLLICPFATVLSVIPLMGLLHFSNYTYKEVLLRFSTMAFFTTGIAIITSWFVLACQGHWKSKHVYENCVGLMIGIFFIIFWLFDYAYMGKMAS